MPHKNKKPQPKSLDAKMLRDVAGKSDTPPVTNKDVNEINSLEVKKWVEEIEL